MMKNIFTLGNTFMLVNERLTVLIILTSLQNSYIVFIISLKANANYRIL